MKTITLIILIFSCSNSITAQQNSCVLKSLSLNIGRVSFGTGDILGIGASVSYCETISKSSSKSFNKLYIEGEINFETGTKNPKTENITLEDFFQQTFRHTSSITLNSKLLYHPFSTNILNGFYIALGPSIGYGYNSFEKQASARFDGSQTNRESILNYNNSAYFGYRVNIGYTVSVNKKYIIGVRADFSNNNISEQNTFAAFKIGKVI